MSAKPQDSALVRIVSPKPTVIRCLFPEGFKLHGCVQNTIPFQVEDDQIFHVIKRPSQVLSDIIEGLRTLHRETLLIKAGKVEKSLIEVHVISEELLDRALAPIALAIRDCKDLHSTYTSYHKRPLAAVA